MAGPVLTDAYPFSFAPDQLPALDLAGALVSWNDAIEIRLAKHEYLKRDGAEQEPMGAAAGRFTMHCTFTGPQWAQSYRAVVSAIRKQPRGLLTHPLLGQMRAACKGIPQAAVDIPHQRDTIDFTLAFEEDQLSTALTTEGQLSPSQFGQQVGDLGAALITASAIFATAAVQVQAFTSSASAYAAAALVAANTNAADATLQQQLSAVGLAASVAITAIRLDPASTSAPGVFQDASSYAAVALAEQLYAACQNLDQATAQQKPSLQPYIVQGPVSLAVLAATIYGGKDGASRKDEIRANNRLSNEYAIPAGTVLMIAPPR